MILSGYVRVLILRESHIEIDWRLGRENMQRSKIEEPDCEA